MRAQQVYSEKGLILPCSYYPPLPILENHHEGFDDSALSCASGKAAWPLTVHLNGKNANPQLNLYIYFPRNVASSISGASS